MVPRNEAPQDSHTHIEQDTSSETQPYELPNISDRRFEEIVFGILAVHHATIEAERAFSNGAKPPDVVDMFYEKLISSFEPGNTMTFGYNETESITVTFGKRSNPFSRKPEISQTEVLNVLDTLISAGVGNSILPYMIPSYTKKLLEELYNADPKVLERLNINWQTIEEFTVAQFYVFSLIVTPYIKYRQESGTSKEIFFKTARNSFLIWILTNILLASPDSLTSEEILIFELTTPLLPIIRTLINYRRSGVTTSKMVKRAQAQAKAVADSKVSPASRLQRANQITVAPVQTVIPNLK